MRVAAEVVRAKQCRATHSDLRAVCGCTKSATTDSLRPEKPPSAARSAFSLARICCNPQVAEQTNEQLKRPKPNCSTSKWTRFHTLLNAEARAAKSGRQTSSVARMRRPKVSTWCSFQAKVAENVDKIWPKDCVSFGPTLRHSWAEFWPKPTRPKDEL